MAEFGAYRYRVFLTGSIRDQAWRNWLRTALETFRIDKDLVGRHTLAGPVPRTLRPVFCDADAALGDGTSLSEETVAALQAAQFLVVLCSPAAALSARVDEEIRRFNAMHRSHRVIPVIVEGSPGHPERDCFPKALRFRLSHDRQPTDECGEPMADARSQADGKELALQKVVARLLGLPAEEMERRAMRGRSRLLNTRRAGMTAMLAVLIAYESGLAFARQELAGNDALLDRTLQGLVLVSDTAHAVSRGLGLPPGVHAGILTATEKTAGALLELGGETSRLRYRKAALLIDLARHYASLGGKASHLRASEADRLMRSLAAEVPGNQAWQRDLSVSYDELGDVLNAQGRPREALAAYRSSVAIAGSLAAEPGNAGRRRDLAASHIKAGDAAAAQGALDDALESYQSSLAMAERLAAADSSDARWQYGLLVAREKIGDVLRVQGEFDQALTSYHASRGIAEGLVAADPGSLVWRRALSVAWIKIGDVLAFAGKHEEALASYRISNAMAERITAAEPGLAGWQNHLAISQDRIGSVLHAQGDLVGALKEYRTSVAIAGRAAAADLRNSDWQRDLATAHEHIGEVMQALGNLPEAQREYEAKRAIITRLAAAEPANPGWQYDLGISHARIGFVLEARGDFPAAASEYEACLRIGRRFAAADPANPRWKRDLAVSYQRLANAHHRLGKTALALVELRRGRDLMAALVGTAPEFASDAVRWTGDLARLDTHIAALQGQTMPSQTAARQTIPPQAAQRCEGVCPPAPGADDAVVVASDLRSRIEALPAGASKLDN